jgi:hypothetical protein
METKSWLAWMGGLLLLATGACDCGNNDTADAGTDAGGGVDSGGNDAGFDAGSDAGPPMDAGCGADLTGRYDLSFTGMCSDLMMDPAEQRVDGVADMCRYYFEVDGTGVASMPFNIMGDSFMDVPMMLGSGMYMCDGTFNRATMVLTLTCTGTAGMCAVTMTRTGPL